MYQKLQYLRPTRLNIIIHRIKINDICFFFLAQRYSRMQKQQCVSTCVDKVVSSFYRKLKNKLRESSRSPCQIYFRPRKKHHYSIFYYVHVTYIPLLHHTRQILFNSFGLWCSPTLFSYNYSNSDTYEWRNKRNGLCVFQILSVVQSELILQCCFFFCERFFWQYN